MPIGQTLIPLKNPQDVNKPGPSINRRKDLPKPTGEVQFGATEKEPAAAPAQNLQVAATDKKSSKVRTAAAKSGKPGAAPAGADKDDSPALVMDLDNMFKAHFNASQAIKTSEIIPVNQLFQQILKDPGPVLSPHQRLYRAIMQEGEGEPIRLLGRKIRTFKAFSRLGGMEEAHEELMNMIADGLDGNEKGRNVIVLLGGPGSGKTETINILKQSLIKSTNNINPVYVLHWENLPEKILKLPHDEGAEVDDPKLSNPLLLYPLEVRQKIQDALNEKFKKKLGFPIYTLTEDELSLHAAKIRDELLKKYIPEVKEEFKKANKDISEEDVLIEATNRIIKNHAKAQRIVFKEDRGIGYLEGKDPNFFDATVISGDVHPAGEARHGSAQDPRAYDYGRSDIIKGQGGMVHFDEMLKVKDTHLNSLLQIAQEGRAKGVAGIREKISTVLLATSNLEEYIRLRKKAANSPLFERMVVVKFRYPRNKNDELNIYKQSFLKQAKEQNIFVAPHALETAALFAVMSRLVVPPNETTEILPVKADLYAGEFGKYPDVPEATIAQWRSDGEVNYQDESKEEGFTGISTRLMRKFLTGLNNSHHIGEKGSVRTLDGFSMISSLRQQLTKNGVFQVSSPEQRQHYDQILKLAQNRLEEAVMEDVKSVIESDEDQLKAAFDNYISRVDAWNDKHQTGNWHSLNERGQEETMEQAEREMKKIEEAMGDSTQEAREGKRWQLAAKIGRYKVNKQRPTLDDNPEYKKAIMKMLSQGMSLGIPIEAIKAANPDEFQKPHQDRFYQLMAKKGYNRIAADEALKCYQRIGNQKK